MNALMGHYHMEERQYFELPAKKFIHDDPRQWKVQPANITSKTKSCF